MVDVWRDGWFRVPEEGKSAEIWMDDDRRDAKMDEHERVEGDKRACVCVCVCKWERQRVDECSDG